METTQKRQLITLDEMRTAIKRAVEERGEDYIYPEEWKKSSPDILYGEDYQCQYRNEDGSPSCIIGLAVSYINPNIILKEFTCAHLALRDMAEDDAGLYATIAQAGQDQGNTWGEAYKAAEAWLANRMT